MKGKRAALYCRVDRGGGQEMRREALTVQRKRLEEYAKENRIQISGYYEDDGFPGHDPERPGLRRLTEAYHAGTFDLLLVVSRSRLYRGNRWNEPVWPFPVLSVSRSENTAF